MKLAVIMGSTRAGRFGPTVAGWYLDRVAQRGDFRADLVDPADAADRTVPGRLAAADAFVVVTPEYNHSYPAPLKALIDDHREPWRAKPVAFVSYGGMSGGLRAVEHLRHVFAELHMVTVRDTISFHGGRSRFDADGRPLDGELCNGAAKAQLDQLAWWAAALAEARARRPYQG